MEFFLLRRGECKAKEIKLLNGKNTDGEISLLQTRGGSSAAFMCGDQESLNSKN